MTFIYRDDPHSSDSGLLDLLDRLQEGDCIEVESFACAAGNARSFLTLMEELSSRGIRFRSTHEQFDTAAPEAAHTLEILKAIAHIGDSDAKEAEAETEETAKGRRPIDVDPTTFDAILKRWRSGEITARQAMSELGLKPNTFYRRVREKMTEMGSEDILNNAVKFGKDIADNARQEVSDIQQSAEKFAADHDLDSLSQSVMDQVGKSINTAGSFLNKSLEALTREITVAVQRFEAQMKQDAEEAEAPVDAACEPVPEAPQPAEAAPEGSTEPVQTAEAQETAEPAQPAEAQEAAEPAQTAEAQEAAEPVQETPDEDIVE